MYPYCVCIQKFQCKWWCNRAEKSHERLWMWSKSHNWHNHQQRNCSAYWDRRGFQDDVWKGKHKDQVFSEFRHRDWILQLFLTISLPKLLLYYFWAKGKPCFFNTNKRLFVSKNCRYQFFIFSLKFEGLIHRVSQKLFYRNTKRPKMVTIFFMYAFTNKLC